MRKIRWVGVYFDPHHDHQTGNFFIVSPSGTLRDGVIFTTILGAVKLTGKTASKTSIGILSAVTAPEYATIEESITEPATGLERTQRREHLIEPLANYFVGRIQQDVLRGNSRVGVLTTAVNREDAESAYLGAMDWDLRLGKSAHQFKGNMAVSRSGSEDRDSGYLAHVRYDKTSGWLTGSVGFSISSLGFNPNDLGFIDRANNFSPWLWMRFRKEQPWWIFRQLALLIGSVESWNLSHKWGLQEYKRACPAKVV
ncbi:TPA: hypothetical protein EYP66_00050 [Candidatus Poribacteria bacterium]|nr:hypothetical protein [Candidatus Poribacteria bacterium]